MPWDEATGGCIVPNVPPWSQDQWQEALERLTLHAYWKMARLYWRGARMVLPGGRRTGIIEPGDIASEAIVDAISGKRKWDGKQDFLEFLRGAVDSKLSHLVTSADSQRARELVATVDGEDPLDSVPARGQGADDPETIVADREAAELFRKLVLPEIRGDQLVERLFECLEAGYEKPAEIADLLGVDVKEIYNAQKRLATKVEKALQKYRKGSK